MSDAVFGLVGPVDPTDTSKGLRLLNLEPALFAVAAPLQLLDLSAVAPMPAIGATSADGGQSWIAPAGPSLATVQAQRLARLRSECAALIVGGFSSSALGAPHSYPSDEHSQSNLQAARNSTAPQLLLMTADADGAWSLIAHNAAQVEQVNADWITFRQTAQHRLHALQSQIATATDVAGVQAISWTA